MLIKALICLLKPLYLSNVVDIVIANFLELISAHFAEHRT